MESHSDTTFSLARRKLLWLRHDEKGTALITALMFMVILTMLGVATLMTSDTEVMLSRNYRLNALALDYANAGVQEAMARMDLETGTLAVGDFAEKASTVADPDQVWNFRSTDSGADYGFISYSGTVTYRLEDDLHHHPSSPYASTHVVTGYCRDSDYLQSPIPAYDKSLPVYVINSTGNVMSGGEQYASAKVRVEVTRSALNIYAPGGMYAAQCPTLSGGAVVHSDPDEPSVSALVVDPNATDPACAGASGSVDSKSVNSSHVDMNSYLGLSMDELKGLADSKVEYSTNYKPAQSTLVWGTEPDNPTIVYLGYIGPSPVTNPNDNDVTVQNLTGYGVLIINGDFECTGSFNWKGLVYVTGNVKLAGGGSNPTNITGAIMCGGLDTSAAGTVNVTYDESMLEDIGKKAFRSRIINWQRVYN